MVYWGYAGAVYVQYVQEMCKGWENVVEWINDTADPHMALTYIFQVIAIFDSVFAAEYLLAMAGGEWMNTMFKWSPKPKVNVRSDTNFRILADDRPYWWVQETDYFAGTPLPKLLQTSQTCETSPGWPSGHVMSASSHVVLLSMWIPHVMADRYNTRVPKWITWSMWSLMATAVSAVGVARMAIATNFPHQVLMGAAHGVFFTLVLTVFVCDDYVWGRYNTRRSLRRQRYKNVACVVLTTVAALALYWGMRAVGVDPEWSVKLAFKWCEGDFYKIKVSSTPLFSLAKSCGSLLGWAVFVTPAVTRYRHSSKRRTLAIAAPTAFVCQYALTALQQWFISARSEMLFYLLHYAIYFVQPFLYLWVVPFVATLPWRFVAVEKKNK